MDRIDGQVFVRQQAKEKSEESFDDVTILWTWLGRILVLKALNFDTLGRRGAHLTRSLKFCSSQH